MARGISPSYGPIGTRAHKGEGEEDTVLRARDDETEGINDEDTEEDSGEEEAGE
jgi:hypothetical protein